MSTEEGTVTRTANGRAWVLIRRSTMCEQCSSRSACHTLGGDREMEAESINTAGAVAGDRVIISIKTRSLLSIAFMFYIIPAMALLAGALAGMKLGNRLGFDPEGASLASALILMAVVLAVLLLIGKKLKKRRDYLPVVSKIVAPRGQVSGRMDDDACGDEINRP
ncbi:MAG: SoxR reducing system RseC family protein [Spirochaetes bacterium]|nr:SoxR reducing system RseC family protein [Spirochaetota bacterium]